MFNGKVLHVTAGKPAPIIKADWEPVVRSAPVKHHNDLCLAFDILRTTGESEGESAQHPMPIMAA
jgi:hypothetical protein